VDGDGIVRAGLDAVDLVQRHAEVRVRRVTEDRLDGAADAHDA